MNNLRSFGEFNTAPVLEGFFSSTTQPASLTPKEKTTSKSERTAQRSQLMRKRKDILGKISKIKSNLDTNPVDAFAVDKSVAAPVEMQPVAAMQAQLESLRQELREVNKMLS